MEYCFDLMVKATEKSVKKIAYIPMNNNHEDFISGKERSYEADESVQVTSERLYTDNELKHIKLDLSYITSNIIVCSYPICFKKQNIHKNTSLVYKKLYRNSLTDLVEYLNKKVGRDHWKIYNLKAEFNEYEDYTNEDLYSLLNDDEFTKSSPTKTLLGMILRSNNEDTLRSKDKLKVGMERTVKNTNIDDLPLSRCGWLDHCPPPLSHLINTVDELNDFVKTNKNNVAVIHCKMGKGRSGCLTVGYLIKCHKMTLKKALEVFKITRFNYGLITGVTIKSQLRFLNYYYYLVENKIDYYQIKTKQFFINRIVVTKPDVNTLSWLGDYLEEDKSTYHYEVLIESYDKEMNDLVLIHKLVLEDQPNDEYFELNTSSLLIQNEDIKITVTLICSNQSALRAIGAKFLEKSIGLSAIYWVNLKAETIMSEGETTKILLPFGDCDNISDRVGLLNQRVNLVQLFKTFKMEYST